MLRQEPAAGLAQVRFLLQLTGGQRHEEGGAGCCEMMAQGMHGIQDA